MPTLPQPEVYLGTVDKRFDANGRLTDDGTRKSLTKFMETFAKWVQANAQS